jgi:hypothetical protein
LAVPDYRAYTTPPFFCSDWLNEWWLEGRAGGSSDYRFLYLGPAGSWTPLHTDVLGSHSWSANLAGRKRWLLWRPGEEPRDGRGEVEWRAGEEEGDGRLEVEQGPGQVLFVPSGWYHQVSNTTDTLSINHNWFNGTSILCVVGGLVAELRRVEREIADCRGEDWPSACQQLLAASHGMNLEDMLELLAAVLARRVRVLEEPQAFQVTFDQEVLGPGHVRFDIERIGRALRRLADIFEDVGLETKREESKNLLSQCNKYL